MSKIAPQTLITLRLLFSKQSLKEIIFSNSKNFLDKDSEDDLKNKIQLPLIH